MEQDYIDTEAIENENKKGNYIIRDKNIKESFSFEELLSKEEIEKLKSIL
jgi:hypothetical protein